MDSGNMTETLGEANQPDDVVVTDSEATEVTPQAEDTEELELVVEVEDDQQQQKSKMSLEQERAAKWEERQKRKKKEKERQAEKERADRLEQELNQLKEQVNLSSRGNRPDPDDYGTTEEFYQAFDEWQAKGKTPVKEEVKQEPMTEILSEDQEWHLYNSEEEIKKVIPSYDDVRVEVEQKLSEAFNTSGKTVFEQIAQFAHTYDVDPAKVAVGLQKMPSKIKDLVKHSSNAAQIGRILRDVEGRVVVQKKRKIDSKPEPETGGGGQVNNANAQIEKAKQEWQSAAPGAPQIRAWQKYQAIKKKVNKDG